MTTCGRTASGIVWRGRIYQIGRAHVRSQTLAKPIEGMRQFPKVIWHLMPGNHDHVRENGLWDRLARTNLPDRTSARQVSGPREADRGDAAVSQGHLAPDAGQS